MFQCIKYEDKREVFGLKIHSFSTLDRIKKYDDSDNEKNAEKPYVENHAYRATPDKETETKN